MKKIFLINVIIICGVLSVSTCTQYGVQHSVLESSPYMDYSSNSAPIHLDGHYGRNFGINFYYTQTDTDIDTSVTGYHGSISLRQRFMGIGDAGFTFNTTLINNTLYGYGAVDGKFYLLNGAINIAPDIGFGTGLGDLAWMFDARTSLIISSELMKNSLFVHFAPRLIGLVYPYYSQESGGITTAYYYTTMPMYGASAGMTVSLPIAPEDMYIVPRLKFTPEVNILYAREPEGDAIKLNIFQVGLAITASF